MSDDNDVIFLAERIADEVANDHNQHRLIFLEGKTGTGKSNAANYLAYHISQEFSKRLGNTPDYYFNVDHIAIITEKELLRVGESIKKFGIYNLDDIGVGFSARDWNSKGNKIIGYILQTFRTFNNVLIMTAPDREFIDKIGRNLLHYKILMTDAFFDYGVSLGTVSAVEKKYYKDSGGNMYPFIRYHNDIYTNVIFERAPDHISIEYEKRRERIQADMQKEKFTELRNELMGEKLDEKGALVVMYREKYSDMTYGELSKKIFDDEGIKISASTICRKLQACNLGDEAYGVA